MSGEWQREGARAASPRRACTAPPLSCWEVEVPAPLALLTTPPFLPLPSQVTAVLVTPEGDIVSASLDKSIRVWRAGQCAAVLQGHEAAVLCLLRLPNGDLLSGSGDCTIRVWSDGKCTHTIPAHSDSVRWVLAARRGRQAPHTPPCAGGRRQRAACFAARAVELGHLHAAALPPPLVPASCPSAHAPLACRPARRRGLALLPNVGVVSASHDQTLKVWTLSGECLAELVGHTALVYCAAATPEGLVASGSEDNTARLWHADGSCLQVGGAVGRTEPPLRPCCLQHGCSRPAAVWRNAPRLRVQARRKRTHSLGLASLPAASALPARHPFPLPLDADD